MTAMLACIHAQAISRSPVRGHFYNTYNKLKKLDQNLMAVSGTGSQENETLFVQFVL